MTGKNIVVTGASSGIGFATVKKLLSCGYSVSACSRSFSSDLESLNVPELKNYYFDMNDIKELELTSRRIIADNDNEIFGLVNSAGVAHGSLFNMTDINQIKNIFEINYFAQLLLIQIFSKKMIRRKAGSIINLASTAGVFADSGTLAYGSSKAALIHSTRVLAVELGRFRIRVNSISPAIVKTKMADLMDEKSADLLNSRKSIKGDILPDDIASIVEFLLSPASENISGQNIRIDQAMFS